MLVPKMIVAKNIFLLYNYISMFCMYSWICLIYWSLAMTVLVSKCDAVHLKKDDVEKHMKKTHLKSYLKRLA